MQSSILGEFGLNKDIISIIKTYVSRMEYNDVLDDLKEEQKNFIDRIIDYSTDFSYDISISSIMNPTNPMNRSFDEIKERWDFPYSLIDLFDGDIDFQTPQTFQVTEDLYESKETVPFWIFRKNIAIEVMVDLNEHYDYDVLRSLDRTITGFLRFNGIQYSRALEGWNISYGISFRNSFVIIRLIGEN